MELSNDQIINISLNIVGFLAAGGLMMLIAGAFRNKKTTATVVTAEMRTAADSKISQPAAPPMTGKKAPTFVPLAGHDSTPPVDTDRRRNRARILELAQQMIADGQSDERIVDLLPISQAELAVLKTTDSDSTGSI
jgi:hypothetical protein